MALLDEARVGMPVGYEALAGFGFGTPLLSQKQYEYGIFSQYQEAIKALGQPPGPPPLAVRGSVEAQNVINTAIIQQQNGQQTVADKLEALRALQEAQNEYQRQVIAELKKLNGDAAGALAHTWLGQFGF